MSGEQPEVALGPELRALVEQELSRIGVRGGLRLEDDALLLRRSTGTTRAEIRGTLAQWDSLPDDLRARRIQQLAGLLAAEDILAPLPARAAQQAQAARRALGLRWYSVFAPISVMALSAAAIAVAYHYLAPSGAGPSLFGSAVLPSARAAIARAVDSDRERSAFAGAACAQTRARVAQGANIGPADDEGWVVELALLRRGAAVDLSAAPGLAKFITRSSGTLTGTVSWANAGHLSAARRFDAEVSMVVRAPLGQNQISGLDLVFSGPYVMPYFTEDQRGEYFRLADALAEELHATDGALFAHCASSDSHQIGSWFLGPTPGGAVASLIYFMASYSELPLLKPNVLGPSSGPPEHGHAFDVISGAASGLDRSAAATLIGRELGLISGRPDHGTRITFPFRDANRATRASVGIARALALANSG